MVINHLLNGMILQVGKYTNPNGNPTANEVPELIFRSKWPPHNQGMLFTATTTSVQLNTNIIYIFYIRIIYLRIRIYIYNDIYSVFTLEILPK